MRSITGIVATGKVVCGVLLSADELLRMEELAVWPGPNFIDHSGLEIYKNCTRHVLSSPSFAEEGVKSIIASSNGLITRHLAIRLKQHKCTTDYIKSKCNITKP